MSNDNNKKPTDFDPYELKHVLQSGYFNKTLRHWQSSNSLVDAVNFILPLFIHEHDDSTAEIASMPNVQRLGVNRVREYLEPIVADGLKCVLLFGVLDIDELKDEFGSYASSDKSPVVRLIPKLREWFPELTIACDVCLCAYTHHGHCGVLDINTQNPIGNKFLIFSINFSIKLRF